MALQTKPITNQFQTCLLKTGQKYSDCTVYPWEECLPDTVQTYLQPNTNMYSTMEKAQIEKSFILKAAGGGQQPSLQNINLELAAPYVTWAARQASMRKSLICSLLITYFWCPPRSQHRDVKTAMYYTTS